MSRIISENYRNRISALINSYPVPLNLSKTIEFFSIEIKKDLSSKENRNRKIFSESDLERVFNIKDSKILKLFSYLNILIDSFKGRHLNIHINEDLSQSLFENLNTLFYWDIISKAQYDIKLLNSELNNLTNLTDKKNPIVLTNASGHEENRLRRERKGLRHKKMLIEFLLQMENSISSGNGILLNVNRGSSDAIYMSDFSEFPESLNSYINYGENLQQIYDTNNYVLTKIDTIINLLPAERGQNIWFNDFIAESINEWNRLGEFNFKKVITITSGEKTPESLLDMQKQNKFQVEEIYTIFPFEIQ